MNVYDFDGTIYNGDSTIDFYFFSLRNKPSILRFVPIQLYGSILYLIKRISTTQFKEYFFSFLRGIDAIDMADEFCKKKIGNINKWYLLKHNEDDVVISASPFFLLHPFCDNIGVSCLIASDVDYTTGKFRRPNCKGKEKVNRYREIFPFGVIDNFYSDSKSDLPIASEAENAFFVINGTVSVWERG